MPNQNMSTHPPKALIAVDKRSSITGLRAIAMLEAVKGAFGLLVALALLSNRHYDFGKAAANLIKDLHINPEWNFGRLFIHAAGRLDLGNILKLELLTFGYAAIRFVEAYGLWRRRVWAEWFALVSGAVYIPFEIYEVILRRTWIPWALLLLNVLIVTYVAYIRSAAWRGKNHFAST